MLITASGVYFSGTFGAPEILPPPFLGGFCLIDIWAAIMQKTRAFEMHEGNEEGNGFAV